MSLLHRSTEVVTVFPSPGRSLGIAPWPRAHEGGACTGSNARGRCIRPGRRSRRSLVAVSPSAATSSEARRIYIGGIDRPRTLAVFGSDGTGHGGVAGRSTGVVSISNRSSGVHCNAVHNAISVESLIWLGSLVNSADTDAADICTPALFREQPPRLGAGPHLTLRGRHSQPPPDLRAVPSSPLSSAKVEVTARRYASSMNVADGRTYRMVELTVQ
jgi:hypothetical protein